MADPAQQQLMHVLSQLIQQQGQQSQATGNTGLTHSAALMPQLNVPPHFPSFQQQHQLSTMQMPSMVLAGLTPSQLQQQQQANSILRLFQPFPQTFGRLQPPPPQPPPQPHQSQPMSSNQVGGYRRPSLIGSNEPTRPMTTAASRTLLPHHQQSSLVMHPPPTPGGLPPQSSSHSVTVGQTRNESNTSSSIDLEAIKRALSESLEKNEMQRLQCGSALKNAKLKVEMLGRIITESSSNSGGRAGAGNNDGVAIEQRPGDAGVEEDAPSLGDFTSLVDRIYAENKKKAAASRAKLQHTLGNCQPQPSSTSGRSHKGPDEETMRIVQETYERGLKLMPSLVKAMVVQRKKNDAEMDQMLNDYETNLTEWEKRVARHENNPKKTARDAKCRELFEKTFPELKKQREDRERSIRTERSRTAMGGQAVATAENIDIGVQFPPGATTETRSSRMHSLAIIPPIAVRPPRRFFDNRNGLVADALADWRGRMEFFLNAWTDWEKGVFEMKVAKYEGKNFAAIAAFLPGKSVKDCVQYYYMSKKRKNYKAKFNKKRKKLGRQYKPPLMPQATDLLIGVEIDATGGFASGQRVVRGGNCVVDCLLCDEKMTIFIPLRPPTMNPALCGFDPYGFEQAAATSTTDDASGHNDNLPLPNQLPVCGKCIQNAMKNKNANRCPLVTCGIGKRKPVRSVPEKFTSLDIEHKRFVVHRLRLPPVATKCCNRCFNRILKEVDSLMDGGLKAEWDAFNEKLMDMEAQQRSGANLLLTTEELGVEEEAPAGDEDDEEGVGDDTTHQPFLNIQRQNSLLAGSAVGLAAPEEPQLDEPARKEIKLEDGVETKNDGRRGDTAYAGGSLTLGTPMQRDSSGMMSEAGLAPASFPYFETNEPSTSSQNFASQIPLIQAGVDPNLLSSLLLAQLGISSDGTVNIEEFSQKFGQYLPKYQTVNDDQTRIENVKQEPREMASPSAGNIASVQSFAASSLIKPPSQRPSPAPTATGIESGGSAEKGRRTNFARHVPQPAESTKTVKQYLSEQFKGSQHACDGGVQLKEPAFEAQQHMQRKTGLATAVLPTRMAASPRLQASSTTNIGDSKKVCAAESRIAAEGGDAEGAKKWQKDKPLPKPSASASLSYENLSDSDEGEPVAATIAGLSQQSGVAEQKERHGSTGCSRPASISQRVLTPVHTPQLALTSRGPELSSGPPTPTAHTFHSLFSNLKQGEQMNKPPSGPSQCVYEPLSDDDGNE